jgi:hypothetical protein
MSLSIKELNAKKLNAYLKTSDERRAIHSSMEKKA